MGCALVTSKPSDIITNREQLRAMIYQAVDHFIELLAPLREQATPPTLQEMSAHVLQTRNVLLGGIMKALTEEVTEQYREASHTDCPCCGRRIQRLRFDSKLISTLNGAFEVKRPYFYCKHCAQGFHPLDEVIALAREVHQYDLQETMALFAAEMPYDRACALFTQATGLTPSTHFGHDTITRVGELTTLVNVIPSRAEIERRIAATRHGQDHLPVLVVSCDGAHAPTRAKGGRTRRGRGKWREVKGFRVYLLGPEDHIIHLAGWHQIQDWEQLAEDLAVVAARIPQDQVRIALVGDGADWVWNVMKRSFPEGRRILDYYHVSEHISKIAKAQYGETLAAKEWREATLARLYLDRAGHVIGGLRRMDPSTTETKEEIRKLIGYLEKHADKFGYQSCRDEGLPIGSGGIESANKYISHARLKLSGAWWLEEHGNAMLRIRCAIYNGTFDQVFKYYVREKSCGSNSS